MRLLLIGVARRAAGAIGLSLLLATAGGSAAAQAATHVADIGRTPLQLPASLSGFSVQGVAVDARGNVYVGASSAAQARVVVFDSTGRYVRDWAPDNSSTARLTDTLLAVGPDGLVYVAPGSGRLDVRVFTPDGTSVRKFGADAGLGAVTGIRVDGSGNVYVSRRAGPDFPDDTIVRFDRSGNVTGRITPVPGYHSGYENGVRALALAPDGSLYVAMDDPKHPFVHIDQQGHNLPVPDVYALIPNLAKIGDVNIANGRLYLSGLGGDIHLLTVAVIGTDGRILDLLSGGGSLHVAATAQNVYVTGLDTTPTRKKAGATARAAAGFRPDLTGEYDVIETKKASGAVGAYDDCESGTAAINGTPDDSGGLTLTLPHSAQGCGARFENFGAPKCSPFDEHGHRLNAISLKPVQGYLGGRPAGAIIDEFDNLGNGDQERHTSIGFSAAELGGGGGLVLIEWACLDKNGNTVETLYEYKGSVDLEDPSGTVIDARSGRPVLGASVRLQFSPTRSGPFGVPGLGGFSPQDNPELTGPTGTFQWNVAPGFWRLRVTAFGYRPLTSQVFEVPPPVTGIILKLCPDPRAQALLIDPAGRVGVVRLRGRLKHKVAGLGVTLRHGRVRAIAVRSRRFRTALGIRLGSSELALLQDYPRLVRGRKAARRGKVHRYRLRHATFTARRGTITAITLT